MTQATGNEERETGNEELGTQSNFTPQVKMQLSAATERLQPNDDDDDVDVDENGDEDEDDDSNVVTIKPADCQSNICMYML